MAIVSTRQAAQFIYDLAQPIIDNLSKELGHTVSVLLPGKGYDKKSTKRGETYIQVLRQDIDPQPLGISASASTWVVAEIQYLIHASEANKVFIACEKTAEQFVNTFRRRRCGYDVVVRSCRWEDTESRDGRVIFTLIIDYEYEGV